MLLTHEKDEEDLHSTVKELFMFSYTNHDLMLPSLLGDVEKLEEWEVEEHQEMLWPSHETTRVSPSTTL